MHLLTDVLWRKLIFETSVAADRQAYEENPSAAAWKWKKDWYDLDYLYLREHPDFRSFYLAPDEGRFNKKPLFLL